MPQPEQSNADARSAADALIVWSMLLIVTDAVVEEVTFNLESASNFAMKGHTIAPAVVTAEAMLYSLRGLFSGFRRF